jgi:hypothetical protein
VCVCVCVDSPENKGRFSLRVLSVLHIRRYEATGATGFSFFLSHGHCHPLKEPHSHPLKEPRRPVCMPGVVFENTVVVPTRDVFYRGARARMSRTSSASHDYSPPLIYFDLRATFLCALGCVRVKDGSVQSTLTIISSNANRTFMATTGPAKKSKRTLPVSKAPVLGPTGLISPQAIQAAAKKLELPEVSICFGLAKIGTCPRNRS